VVKSVNTRDLKSLDRKVLPVQVWSGAPSSFSQRNSLDCRQSASSDFVEALSA
jgi:hypothetical protein